MRIAEGIKTCSKELFYHRGPRLEATYSEGKEYVIRIYWL
jgi:hypothetical protein